MKNFTRVFAACLIVSVALFSCSKKKDPVSVTTYTTIQDVFNDLKLQPKTVSLDAVAGGSFYGNSGTRYIFTPNSFITAGGAAVTGNVQLQVCEYLQKGDMLFSKILPISGLEPLVSGGEINVAATQNGQQVFLKPGAAFTANVPLPQAMQSGMSFFAGVADHTTDSDQVAVNWIPRVQDSLNSIAPAIVGQDTISIISDSLRLCNADGFLTSPDYQQFTINIAVTGATLPTSAAVRGYTLYDQYKGVWPMGLIGSQAYASFTEDHVPDIPVHFVVFTIINGNFYGGIAAATPATGSTYTVTLSQQDANAFKAQVNAL